MIGGGAAGFFTAVNLKAMCPQMDVTIFERSSRVLAKVAVSGGGRCNVTNTFEGVTDFSSVYPRGHRLMKRLMKGFSERDAYEWFESHGVRLTVQDDHCVFPAAKDARVIVDCLTAEAHRRGVEVLTGTKVGSLAELEDYDFRVVTTGGQPRGEGLRWLEECGHETVAPVPSLFTFKTGDATLHSLMGTVADDATVAIAGTRLKARGPLLVTHWGMSGPAILKLSSYAARQLADGGYRAPLTVNWTSHDDAAIRAELTRLGRQAPGRQLTAVRPFGLTTRLWTYLAGRALGDRAHAPWDSLNAKETNRLVNTLANDAYTIDGRAPFKDEFVTCGGVALTAVDAATLESRHVPRLYFAGEVLDIDGVTGGFNFQAAWTTAYTVCKAISVYSYSLE